MKNMVQITNNLGKQVLVSKEFAEVFNKSKEYSKSLGDKFGKGNNLQIEDYLKEKRDKQEIKKGFEQWL